jgi:ketosteroid isomerase-like protein
VNGKVDEFLTEWHRIVSEKDLAALGTMLAEDVSLGVPPYWDKIRGRDMVQHLLGIVIHTIEEVT